MTPDEKEAVARELARLESALLGHQHATASAIDASEQLARAARASRGNLAAVRPLEERTGARAVAAPPADLTARFAAIRAQR